MQQRDKQSMPVDNRLFRQRFQAMLDQLRAQARSAHLAENAFSSYVALFEALFQQYHRLLSAYIFNLLNSVEATQDIVQDTWLALFCQLQRQSPSWLENVEILAWLLTVAKRKSLNYLKSQRRCTSLEADKTAFIFEPHVPPFDYPENITMRSEVHNILYQALGALSKRQREVLALRFFYDFGLDEIAQALAIPLNTVRSHLARGKEHLRQLLLDRGVEQGDLAFWTWPDGIDAQLKNLLSHTAPPGD